MSEPERWLTSPEAPGAMREMLSAAQKVGPSTMERAALAGKIGVATSGLWVAPVLKGLAASALVAGGVWIAATSGGPAAPKGSQHVPPAPQHLPLGLQSSEKSQEPARAVAPELAPELAEPVAEPPSEANAHDALHLKSQAKVREAAAMSPKPTEISLISGARSSLESAPQRALSLLSEHAKIYPTGVLAEEREVLRIRALKNLGRDKDAQAEEQKFHKEHPDSVHHVP